MLAALLVQILSVDCQICPLKDWLYNLTGVSPLIRLPADEGGTYFIPLQAEIQTSTNLNQCDPDTLYCHDDSKDLFASDNFYCYGEEYTTTTRATTTTTSTTTTTTTPTSTATTETTTKTMTLPMQIEECLSAACNYPACTFNEPHQPLESFRLDLLRYLSLAGTNRSVADYSSLDCGVSITSDSVEFLPMETESSCRGELPYQDVIIDLRNITGITNYTVSLMVDMDPLSLFSTTPSIPIRG